MSSDHHSPRPRGSGRWSSPSRGSYLVARLQGRGLHPRDAGFEASATVGPWHRSPPRIIASPVSSSDFVIARRTKVTPSRRRRPLAVAGVAAGRTWLRRTGPATHYAALRRSPRRLRRQPPAGLEDQSVAGGAQRHPPSRAAAAHVLCDRSRTASAEACGPTSGVDEPDPVPDGSPSRSRRPHQARSSTSSPPAGSSATRRPRRPPPPALRDRARRRVLLDRRDAGQHRRVQQRPRGQGGRGREQQHPLPRLDERGGRGGRHRSRAAHPAALVGRHHPRATVASWPPGSSGSGHRPRAERPPPSSTGRRESFTG